MKNMKVLQCESAFVKLMEYMENENYLEEASVNDVIEKVQEYIVPQLQIDTKPWADSNDQELKIAIGALQWVSNRIEKQKTIKPLY